MNTETNLSTNQFRFYLQRELMNRCAKNPQYSLRAFAKSLGVQAPTLSHILRGTRPLSAKMVKELSKALSLGPSEIQQFLQTAPEEQDDFNQMAIDHFHLISDWYHFAILEMLTVKKFKEDAKWIARVLGITPNEVNIAIERLIRLDMLHVDKNGKYKASENNRTTTNYEFTSVALKKLQTQFLNKAIEAVDSVAIEKRDHTGMTLSVAMEDMSAIKKRIKEFRRELMTFIERKKKRDEVYQLSIAFFPLTKILEIEKE